MKVARSVLTILLLLFVVVTVGTLIAQEVTRPETQVADSTKPGPAETPADEVGSDAMADPEPEALVPLPANESDLDEVSLADESVDASLSEPTLAEPACVIEAVYFHNTYRCVTCLKIEGDAKAIAEEVYADEFAAGTLVWFAVNMEEQRSAIEQYDLTSPSLVLIRKSGDEIVDWVLLEETWSLVRSTTRFSAYIIESFNTFLEGCL